MLLWFSYKVVVMLTFIKWIIGKITMSFVPERTKRMLFLTGSAAALSSLIENKADKEKFISRLNDEFQLASSQESLLFAIEVGRILWRDLKHRMNENKLNRLAMVESILQATPASLKYADDDTLRQDLNRVLSYDPVFA